jgi:hypothetical protein
VQRRQVREQRLEVVAVAPSTRCRPRADGVVVDGRRRRGQPAVAVVLAVDPHGVKWPASVWISRRKSCAAKRPSPSEPGQRVGGRRDPHARLDQPLQQGRDEDGVTRVVELELVDREQPVPRQRLDRLREAERAHQVGQLDEGAVRARLGAVVPERASRWVLARRAGKPTVSAGGGGIYI